MGSYRTVDDAFLGTAAIRGSVRQPVPADAATTFRALEDAEAWPVWLDSIKRVVWTSPDPKGVGTTRDIHGVAGTISERFFAWEDGHRMAFHFSSGKLPVFSAFAEDYVLEPTGAESCDVVWSYGIELRGVFKVLRPLVAFGIGRAGKKWFRQFEGFMAEHRGDYPADG